MWETPVFGTAGQGGSTLVNTRMIREVGDLITG